MVNCLHSPGDVECIILFLVVYLALVGTCVAGIVAGICCIVKRILKQRRDDLTYAEENPPYVLTVANTQGSKDKETNINVNQAENVERTHRNDPQGKNVFRTFTGSIDNRAYSEEDLAGLTNVKPEQNCRNDANEDTDEQKTANPVSQTSKTKDNRKQVFVLLKDDMLRVCIDILLKGTGLIPNYFNCDNEQTDCQPRKFKFEDEMSTIIVVRHGSTRIDSDVAGCCKHIADSDMKRTIVVIINEYANNKKGEHGEVMKPNSYVIDYINDLKNVVVFNYKCCIEKKKCKRCKDAFEEFKQHARSPNYK